MINNLQEAYLQIYQNEEFSSEQEEDLSEAKVKYTTITRNGERVRVPVMTDALRAAQKRKEKKKRKCIVEEQLL